ncbi:hypothetical protein [Streptomyces sp. NPDC049881]|uniref:hypothetical protein n=1 Tax=Streptomyces sp. NPDC049881 TaxID=3155778 RepID=UPI003426FF0F
MTEAACGATRRVAAFIQTTMIMWDVQRVVRCDLQAHGPEQDHVGHLAQVSEDLHSVLSWWARWRDDERAMWFGIIADCPMDSPDDQDYCTFFRYHPGACSWAVGDPEEV